MIHDLMCIRGKGKGGGCLMHSEICSVMGAFFRIESAVMSDGLVPLWNHHDITSAIVQKSSAIRFCNDDRVIREGDSL